VRKWSALSEALLASLREFHTANPLLPGKDMEELREKLPGHIPARIFRAFVDRLEAEKVIVREGNRLRLPGHTITLGDDEQRMADRITALLGASPLSPPSLSQLEHETGTSRATLVRFMRLLERTSSVVRVNDDLYFLRGSIDGMVRTLRSDLSTGHEITPAMFRDRFNTSRKYTIPLLEYLDREGITVRVGDIRRVKPAGPAARL
jgi:selenocysteine-specific elongation factor